MDGGAYVDVPGARIRVWVRDGSGPSVLVVHGGPDVGSGYLRRHLPPSMPEDARLIFADLRGTGCSVGNGDGELDAERMAWDLARVLELMGEGSTTVLGHSFGGIVAIMLAATASDHVERLVLVDPDPPRRCDWEAALQTLEDRLTPEERTRIEEIEQADAWRLDPGEAYSYLRLRLRAHFFDPEVAETLELDLPPHALALFGSAGTKVREAAGAWDLSPWLDAVHVPVLVITGPASPVPEESLRRLAQDLPRGRLTSIPNTGHFPFLEAPDAFRREVSGFLVA